MYHMYYRAMASVFPFRIVFDTAEPAWELVNMLAAEHADPGQILRPVPSSFAFTTSHRVRQEFTVWLSKTSHDRIRDEYGRRSPLFLRIQTNERDQ
jgi:hypothetical protein